MVVPVAAILVFAGLQVQHTHHGVVSTPGNMYRKAPTVAAAPEQAQHIAANFGWVVQLWATEIYSQGVVVELLYHMVDVAGADGALVAKCW